MSGDKFDDNKLQYHLIPSAPIAEVVKVLMFGASKYSPDNWKKVKPYQIRYYNACIRHIESWRSGEARDPETGLHHLAHAICCLIFILWKELK